MYCCLGIRTTTPMSLSVLSKKLVGFLEIIPEQQFRVLQRLHYPSLYSFKYSPDGEEEKTYYFVLFGTVALCNSSHETNVEFTNFDHVGDLLLWETTMTFNEEVRRSNDHGGITRFQSGDFFEVCDGRPSPNGDLIAPFGIEEMFDLRRTFFVRDSRRKKDLFVKVILHDVSFTRFHNTHYGTGEEVFVKYNLNDPLI